MTKLTRFAALLSVLSAVAIHADPILISGFEDLMKIGNDASFPLDGDYILTADIDAAPSRNLNEGAGFKPLGQRVVIDIEFGGNVIFDTLSAFRGSFDGNGFTVKGLYINRPNASGGMVTGVGLFGYVHGGSVRNLTVIADSVVGYQHVGGIAGGIGGTDALIDNCHVRGAIVGNTDVGGIAGVVEFDATVTASYTLASISASGDRVGGIAGENEFGVISNCYSLSSVSGGGDMIGGIAGRTNWPGSIRNCYAAGPVKGSNASGILGAFIGSGGEALTNCYWDTELTGISGGRTTKELTQRETFFGWNFQTGGAWGISNNFPYLRKQPAYTMTFSASNAGGTVNGDSIHIQTVNFGVNGVGVTAALTGLGTGFDGWETVSGDDKAVKVLSNGDSTITFSNLIGNVEAVARFILKNYTVTYTADSGGLIALIDGDGNINTETAADTLELTVDHGAVAPVVAAVPDTGFLFTRWAHPAFPSWWDPATETRTADTITSDTTFTAKFTIMKFTLKYAGDEDGGGTSGLVRINEAGASIPIFTADSVHFNTHGPSVFARPVIGKEHLEFVRWSDGVEDNPRIDSLVRGNIDVYAIFEDPVATADGNRIIVSGDTYKQTSVILPAVTSARKFTVGSNPAAKGSAAVNFYWDGFGVGGGVVFIYDANGNVVKKINIDRGISRLIAAWDLTDRSGRRVPAGTYLVRGTIITADGKKVNVSVMTGVR